MERKKVVPRNLKYLMEHFQKSMANPLQTGKKSYKELAKPFRYINHSCNPNAAIAKKDTLVAIKKIKSGEEITYDYSTTIDESFECTCGSKNCRGAIGDFFALPKNVRKYYFKKKRPAKLHSQKI